MRDRIERLVLLPFSMGCVSESSIAVGAQFRTRSKRNANSTTTSLSLSLSRTGHAYEHTQNILICIPEDDKEEEEDYEDDEESHLSLLAAPKFHRLFKNFKNFSQFFVYKDDDDDEMDEDDMGMEIGFPTDVKHVTHIGIDGSATSILSKGWDNRKEPEFNPQPSVSSILSKSWDNTKEPEFNPRASVDRSPSEPTNAEKLNLKGPSEIAYV